jgi:hypothetical protein
MKTIKGLSALLIIVLFSAAPVSLGAETFEDRGLHPVAIIVDDHTFETFDELRTVLEKSGAKGLNLFPPDVLYGYVPAGFGTLDLGDLDVTLVDSADDPSIGALGAVMRGVVRNLLDESEKERYWVPTGTGPLNDILRRVPPEIVEMTKYSGPLMGSPSELQGDRSIQQNSEFMIGTVLVNIVLPESMTGSEDWTDEEIAAALSDLARGCQDYQQHALWTDLTFIYNHKDFHRVPVSLEPIEGDWNSDPIWISQAMSNLGYPSGDDMMRTHEFNNETRTQFGADWVFTAYVVDASVNECWQGSAGQYAAYAYLGGPYLVVSYPSCGYGTGIGFSKVFIHEMSHIFWALDEYASAEQSCNDRSGYLSYANRNTLFNPCQETVSCIMQSGLQESPLPVCYYTRGQVGLGAVDYYWGTIPEIYNVFPGVEFRETTELSLDTVFSMPYEMGLHVWNDAVPNENPYQDPFTRIDYAAKIESGFFWINGSLEEEMEEPLTGWTSNNWFKHTIPSLEPGRSDISYRFENIVGLTKQISKSVYYIGIKYYFTELTPGEDRFDVSWSTSGETFGAVFDVVKENVTAGTGEEVVGTVVEPTNFIGNRRVYTFFDENIEPAQEYRYCIVGRFQVSINGEQHEIRVPTGDMYEISPIPNGNDLVSYLLPNPTSSGTSITIDIPKSYYDPSGTQDNATQPATLHGALAVEVLTPVDIGVYNIKGQRIATVYNNKLYGSTRTFQWSGTDSYGRLVAPGVYFMRVVAGNKAATKKVVIIR